MKYATEKATVTAAGAGERNIPSVSQVAVASRTVFWAEIAADRTEGERETGERGRGMGPRVEAPRQMGNPAFSSSPPTDCLPRLPLLAVARFLPLAHLIRIPARLRQYGNGEAERPPVPAAA